MKKLSSTIMVDKDDGIDTNAVMNSIFSCDEDDDLFNNVYKTIKWEMSEWFIKKGVKQKKEDIYIYVETLPDYFKSYTVENDKFLRICIKHKICKSHLGPYPPGKAPSEIFVICPIGSEMQNMSNMSG